MSKESRKINRRLVDTYLAPMQSMVHINGSSLSPRPAITGWQKYGPNLHITKYFHQRSAKSKKDISSDKQQTESTQIPEIAQFLNITEK